jgi:hypothetical protein
MVVIYETLSNTEEPPPEIGTDLASIRQFIRSLPDYYLFSIPSIGQLFHLSRGTD